MIQIPGGRWTLIPRVVTADSNTCRLVKGIRISGGSWTRIPGGWWRRIRISRDWWRGFEYLEGGELKYLEAGEGWFEYLRPVKVDSNPWRLVKMFRIPGGRWTRIPGGWWTWIRIPGDWWRGFEYLEGGKLEYLEAGEVGSNKLEAGERRFEYPEVCKDGVKYLEAEYPEFDEGVVYSSTLKGQ